MKGVTYINDRSVDFKTAPNLIKSLDVDENSGMRWLRCPGLVSNVDDWYYQLMRKGRDWKDYYEDSTFPNLGWLP